MKKKNINTFTVIYKKVRGGYTAWVEEMPGVISEGKTRGETEKNIKDALELMLETNRILSLKDAVGDIERSTISFPRESRARYRRVGCSYTPASQGKARVVFRTC